MTNWKNVRVDNVFKLLLLVTVLSGCSIKQQVAPVDDPEAANEFLKSTNLTKASDRYWIIDIPETKSALGSVYAERTKSIDDQTYTGYSLISERFFTNFDPEKHITKEEFTLSKQYHFRRSESANISVMTALTGTHKDVSEVNRKVNLSSVWKVNTTQLSVDVQFCREDRFYVTRVYLGDASDYGLKEVISTIEIAGFEVGGSAKSSTSSTLHIIKEGALALMLQPVSQLSGCGSETGTHDGLEKAVESDLEAELRAEGYSESE